MFGIKTEINDTMWNYRLSLEAMRELRDFTGLDISAMAHIIDSVSAIINEIQVLKSRIKELESKLQGDGK